MKTPPASKMYHYGNPTVCYTDSKRAQITQEMNKDLENFTEESGFTKRVADYSCKQLYYWTWVSQNEKQ